MTRAGEVRRRWLGPLAVAVAVLVGGYVTYVILGEPSSGLPLDPSSTDPSGTKAIVEIARELGATVDVSRSLPDASDDVALLLVDTLTESQRRDLTQWVEDGGRLVLADPSSELSPPLLGDTTFGLIEATLPRRCDVPAFADVRRVDAASSFVYETPADATGCFVRGDGAWLVIEPVREGLQVSVGGPTFLTNGTIPDADNAILAAALLAPEPGTRVQFVRPPRPGEAVEGSETLADLVPSSVQLALLQLVVAFAIVVVWRMFRLGQPVEEPQPVALAGSDLVVAVGDLLHQTQSRARAAQLIRDSVRRELSERLGVPASMDDAAVADAAAARTGVPRDDVLRVLDAADPTTDAGVLTLAADAERVRARVLADAIGASASASQ